MSDAPRYPDIDGKKTDDQVLELKDYIINLHRYIRYALNNIGVRNMTKTTAKSVRKIDGLEGKTEELSSSIEQTSESITQTVERLTKVEGDMEEAETRIAEAEAKAKEADDAAKAAQTAADEADAKAQQAAADLTTAQQNLAAVTSRVDVTEEEITAAQEAVETAQVAANTANANAVSAASAAQAAAVNAAAAQAAADAARTTADNAISNVEQLANNISLSVKTENGKASIVIGTDGSGKRGEIDLQGYVTFSNLTDGKTIIDGGNIKTGTIEGVTLKGCEIISQLENPANPNDGIKIQDSSLTSCNYFDTENGVQKFDIVEIGNGNITCKYSELGVANWGIATNLHHSGLSFNIDGEQFGDIYMDPEGTALELGCAGRIELVAAGGVTINGKFYAEGNDMLTSETQIPAGSDLNNYRGVGIYCVPSSSNVAGIKNRPSGLESGFRMKVYSPLDGQTKPDGNWLYRVQEIMDLSGNMFRRGLSSSGSGTWAYSDWKLGSYGLQAMSVKTNNTSNLSCPAGKDIDLYYNNQFDPTDIFWSGTRYSSSYGYGIQVRKSGYYLISAQVQVINTNATGAKTIAIRRVTSSGSSSFVAKAMTYMTGTAQAVSIAIPAQIVWLTANDYLSLYTASQFTINTDPTILNVVFLGS